MAKDNITPMSDWIDSVAWLDDNPIGYPFTPEAKPYKIREAIAYCKKKGISTGDMTVEEVKMFEYE